MPRYFLSRQNLVKTGILFVVACLIGGGVFFLSSNQKSDEGNTGFQKAPANLPSANWFVSRSGNDKNSGKQPEQAFATIQKAVEQARPGQAIELLDGTYKQSFQSVRDGTAENPITIMGSRDAVVVGAESRIVEIHHDYIRLTGFTINGHHGSGNSMEDYRDKLIYAIGTEAKDGVEGLKIDHMLLENAGGECVRLRYFAKQNEIAHVTVRNCGIYDYRFNDGGKNGEGIYIGTAPEQLADGKNPTDDPDESSDNWVHHNDIKTNGNECVDVKEAAHHNLVEHNSCTGQLDPESGGLDARGDHNTFRHNDIYDNAGAGVRLGGDGEQDGIHNNVYENVIKNNQGYGIKIMRSPQGDICSNDFSGNGEEDIGGDEGEDLSPSRCR